MTPSTMVLPLGTIPTADGDSYGLLALRPGGTIGLAIGTSWADAGTQLRPQLVGPVQCDPALTTVARRLGWDLATPTEAQYLERAGIAVAFAEELSPKHHLAMVAFCRAWVGFFRLALWEAMSAETSLPVLRKKGRKKTEHALTFMGQAKQEYGFAFYEDLRAFDAVWSGEHFPMDGLSVLADDSPFLLPVFRPFGVPPPQLTHVEQSHARPPTLEDYVLATASMQLLLGAAQGEVVPQALGDGVLLDVVPLPPPRKPGRRRP